VGLFQAVKYRALKEAMLKIGKLNNNVEAVLVAHDVPEQTKELAELLNVKVHVIPRIS